MNTRFWKDVWYGNRTLEDRFPRMATLASDRNASVNEYWSSQGWNIIWRREIREGVELSQHFQLMSCIQVIRINLDQDVWQWKFDDEESFTIRTVNVFAWRAMRNQLPTRTSLDTRGIDIDSLLCPFCNSNMEDSNHVFFSCNVALELWNKIVL
ncbi:RNA-directed DNA polymerase, eukaryota [Tanacetum coccineum]